MGLYDFHALCIFDSLLFKAIITLKSAFIVQSNAFSYCHPYKTPVKFASVIIPILQMVGLRLREGSQCVPAAAPNCLQ